MPRKRTHDEMVASDPPAPPQKIELLHKIRNMWEFAALYEFVKVFGSVVKTPHIDIEVGSLHRILSGTLSRALSCTSLRVTTC